MFELMKHTVPLYLKELFPSIHTNHSSYKIHKYDRSIEYGDQPWWNRLLESQQNLTKQIFTDFYSAERKHVGRKWTLWRYKQVFQVYQMPFFVGYAIVKYARMAQIIKETDIHVQNWQAIGRTYAQFLTTCVTDRKNKSMWCSHRLTGSVRVLRHHRMDIIDNREDTEHRKKETMWVVVLFLLK